MQVSQLAAQTELLLITLQVSFVVDWREEEPELSHESFVTDLKNGERGSHRFEVSA